MHSLSLCAPGSVANEFRSPGTITNSSKLVIDAVGSCATRAAPALAARQLDALRPGICRPDCRRGMATHLDKVHHITTTTRVTADLDQEDEWMRDVANDGD